MKRLNMNHFWGAIFFSLILLAAMPASATGEERLSVKASIANMRSGPGTETAVMWQVEQYHPVIVIEKKGNWYKIKDFENDVAWLHKSLLDNAESVITHKDKCNVRSKPDTNSTILFTVDRGVPFKVLEKKGEWIRIRHVDGDTGWIHNSLVW